MLREFVTKHSPDPANVALINASPLVDLVEDGSFLFVPDKSQSTVNRFVQELFEQHPLIDTLTLSSTHLPWLKHFFEKARPECRFLDPAQDVAAGIGPGIEGSGIVRGFVTEDASFDLKSLRAMLRRIGVEIPLEAVAIQ
jgi:glutamate racemase